VAPRGTRIRGHEFHASCLDRPLPPGAAAYRVLAPGRRLEGFARPRLLASYVHLSFLGQPRLAARLVAAASAAPG
jgi:cobyrinic acid a,c-diamide synthase